MANILRNPVFTRLYNTNYLVDYQPSTNIVINTTTPADTTHILRSAAFTKLEVKRVDQNQLIVNLLTSTLGITSPLPFNLSEWPNPKGYRSNGLLTWLNTNTVFIPGPGIPTTKIFDYPNPTLGIIRREYGYIQPSYLIGGIPPTPLATLFAGRVVALSELTEIDGRNWRKGMEQVLIREAAKALGRQGGIASGKTRRRG